MRRHQGVLLGAVFLLVSAVGTNTPASADSSATLAAAADSWVDAGNPTVTHGSNGYLQIDNSPVLRAYLAFDVVVPPGETLTSAQLRLTPIVANATGFQIRTSEATWAESSLAFQNAPAPGETVYGTSGPLTAGVATSTEVSAAIPAGGGRVSFVIDNLTSSSYGLRSREAATVSQRPQLLVTTTSAPGPSAPVAGFTASPSSGTAPLAVAFTDTSTGEPTSWDWDFGDGGSSAAQNPTHTFGAGSWTVRLTVANAGGSSTTTRTITATAPSSDIGIQGGSYSGAITAPTGEKPQSKLWWNDGSWWADMFQPLVGDHRIFRLDRASQQWVDTGTGLDDRSNTKADVLWDGSQLYVASNVYASSSSAAITGNPTRLYRYSYQPFTGSYSLDLGFPVNINNVSAEAVVLSKDSTGRLWATWTQAGKVYVNRSALGGLAWETPIVLPAPGASGLPADDISAVVSYGGSKTAVVWSNQANATLWFGSHPDSSATGSGWTFRQIIQGPRQVDDHIALRSLDQDASGRLYAVTKTGANDASPADPNAALIKLFVRDPATGSWTSSTVGRVAQNHTRPILVLDDTHQRVYVFMTGPSTAGSGAFEGSIYMKSAPMSALSFPEGLGTPVIRDLDSPYMNNATSTKQSVTGGSGLVVVAGNDRTKRYWHADLALLP